MNSREDTGAGAAGTQPMGDAHSCCSSRGHDEGHAHEHAAGDSCCAGKGAGSGGCCGGGRAAPSEQVLVFSRRQIRELDRLAVEEFAMPSILLMENAARGVAGVILDGLQGIDNPAVLLVCGPGNNGGDGLAVARHLANRWVRTAIVLGAAQSAYKGNALTNLRIAQKMDLPIFEARNAPGAAMAAAGALLGEPVVVVDALLGTGLDRPAAGGMAELIGLMNGMKAGGCTLVAVDVPSGLDCDTGEPGKDASGAGPVVEADLTVALAGVKAGFTTSTAQKYVGELVVVDIGAPRELMSRLGRPLGAPEHECAKGRSGA